MRGKRHFQNMEEMGGRQEMTKGKKDSGMEGKELLQRGVCLLRVNKGYIGFNCVY